MSKFTRRAFLFAAPGVVSVVAAREALLVYCRRISRNTPNFFAGLHEDNALAAARVVGRKVKAQHPDFGTERVLAQFYGERPLLVAAHEQSCPDTRHAMVQRQCCQDFAAGNMLIVDGWVISETEAQLCAAMA
jgi:hypothetical protein